MGLEIAEWVWNCRMGLEIAEWVWNCRMGLETVEWFKAEEWFWNVCVFFKLYNGFGIRLFDIAEWR